FEKTTKKLCSSSTKLGKKKKKNIVKKKFNGFTYFLKAIRPELVKKHSEREAAVINMIASEIWKGFTKEEKSKYTEKAILHNKSNC
ncbi:MAG: Transcription factor 7-like 2, partial [Paramarteilia canceri]